MKKVTIFQIVHIKIIQNQLFDFVLCFPDLTGKSAGKLVKTMVSG
jgi:hypothetical protein